MKKASALQNFMVLTLTLASLAACSKFENRQPSKQEKWPELNLQPRTEVAGVSSADGKPAAQDTAFAQATSDLRNAIQVIVDQHAAQTTPPMPADGAPILAIDALVTHVKTQGTHDPHDLKKAIDGYFTQKHADPSLYNSKAVSIFDRLQTNKMQCHSGTLLYGIVATLAMGPARLAAENHVWLYTAGHVLPGYMTFEKGVWHVHGIETTAEGRALVKYGPVNDIPHGKMRIVHANYAIIIEATKGLIRNPKAVANQAIHRTAMIYRIKRPLYVLESTDVAIAANQKAEMHILNNSVFRIRGDEVPEGDHVRATFDEKDGSDFSTHVKTQEPTEK